jgi:hypothetical protein
VEGKSMMDRASSSPARVGESALPPDPTGEGSDPLQAFLSGVAGLVNSITDLSIERLVSKLMEMLQKAAVASASAAGATLGTLMGQLAEPVKWLRKLLTTKIEIPFISELYEWITGRPLTLLSVLSLVLAIPLNIVYALITLVFKGEARFFFDDAANMPQQMLAMAGLAPRLSLAEVGGTDAATVPGTPMAPEVALMIAKCFCNISGFGNDVLFEDAVELGTVHLLGVNPIMAWANCYRGVWGVIGLSVQTFCSRVAFEDRVRAVAGAEADKFLPPYVEIVYTVYSLQMVLAANKLRGGVQLLVSGPGTPNVLDELKDKLEFPLCMAVAGVAGFLIVWQIVELDGRLPQLKRFGNEQLAEEYRLLAIRDILALVPVLFEWMYTEGGYRWIRKGISKPHPFYVAATRVRWAFDLASMVMHGKAVFEYGGM